MKDVRYEDVVLVGKEKDSSKIDVIPGRTHIIIGGGFERKNHVGLKSFSNS